MSGAGWVAGLASLVLLATGSAARADAPVPVDRRFDDQLVIGGLDAPTTMRIAPDGDIYVAEKAGLVVRFDAPDFTTSEVVVDIRTEVADYLDRGLLGLELDPGFAVNRRLYLLYTFDAAPEDSVPRGTDCASGEAACIVSGKLVKVALPLLGKAQPGDFTTLIGQEWCQQFTSHSIGTVLFGPDGALYAGAGEGANFDQVDYGQFGTPPNPCGDPPGGKGVANSIPTAEGGSLRSQDVRTASDPIGLDGTIVRVNPDTGAPLTAGPFTADANARRIVAYGFRNPFRFTFRPGTRELWIGDVGQTKVEEIDRVPDAAGGQGLNFGWPCREGEDVPADWQQLDLCKSLTASTAPYFSYRHSRYVAAADDADHCPLNYGAALSGVAFQTPASGWPGKFADALFFSDFARGCIWFMPAGTDGLPDPTRVERFATGTPGAGAIDLRTGPGGALYYVHWDPMASAASGIHRIDYVPEAPHAKLTATPASGVAPLAVHLDASASSDPDGTPGSPLHYAWDLDGDGGYDDGPDQPVIDHSFPAGDVRVRVRVTDPDGLTGTASVTVHAGNTAPVPVIDKPARGTLFSVGDRIDFQGSASDGQDGAVSAPRLSWTVRQAHCPGSDCHRHPLMDVPGAGGGSFTAPDHELPSFLEITLTATDSGGLATSVTRRIDPRVATVRVETEPAGIPVRVLGHAPAPAPQQASVIDGAPASIAAPAAATVGGATWRFLRWEDGSASADRVVTVRGTTVRRAVYAAPATTTAPGGPGPLEPTTRALTQQQGLGFRLHAVSRVRLARRLRVRATCTLACRLTAAGTLRGLSGKARRLPRVRRQASAEKAVRLTLVLSRTRVAAVRRRLHAGHRVSLRVVVTATGSAGQRAVRRATIRVTR